MWMMLCLSSAPGLSPSLSCRALCGSGLPLLPGGHEWPQACGLCPSADPYMMPLAGLGCLESGLGVRGFMRETIPADTSAGADRRGVIKPSAGCWSSALLGSPERRWGCSSIAPTVLGWREHQVHRKPPGVQGPVVQELAAGGELLTPACLSAGTGAAPTRHRPCCHARMSTDRLSCTQ